MAILKDLIVHGSSRFLNKIYADELEVSAFEAESAIIKKLTAKDATLENATVIGLLDVQGQLHTNTWTNSNIATIDGCFYITPTLSSDSGKISFSSTSVASLTGTYTAVTSLYIGDSSSGSTVQWTKDSKVLLTGEVEVNGQWLPLGTLLGTLSANATTSSIGLTGLTDNRHNTSSIITDIRNAVSNASLNYRNLKISLYQRKDGTDSKPLGIYMTAMGTNGKTFIDIYGGVNATTTAGSSGGFADPNLRIGNLSGLGAVEGTTPTGWGIYTTNGYFKGVIVSSAGKIGNFTINSALYSNNHSAWNSNVSGIYINNDGISGGAGGKWWLWNDGSAKIGAMTLSAAGVLTVPAANVSGKLTAATIDGTQITANTITAGQIAASAITADELAANAVTSAKIKAGQVKATNIASSAVTADKLDATTINASNKLTVGALTTATQNNILNSNIQIGGTNLLKNTDATTIAKTITIASTSSSTYSEGWTASVARVEGENTYTVSFDAKADDDSTTAICHWYNPNTTQSSLSSDGHSGTGADGYVQVSLTTDWKRYWVTWTQSDTASTNKSLIVGRLLKPSSGTKTIYVRAIKMEVGNKATAWSPAPEEVDVRKYITDIDSNKGITIKPADTSGNDYLQMNSSAINFYRNNVETLKIEDSAIRVGKLGNNLRNVYITDSAVQIRNNTSVLAEYGSSIKLYQPTTTTVAVEISSTGATFTGNVKATSLSTGTKTAATTGKGTFINSDGAIYVGNGGTNNFTVTDTGIITATGANLLTATIGNATNKITIGTGTAGHSSIRYGMTTLVDPTNDGFYIGTDGIALGKGAFKVTAAGALTATSGSISGGIVTSGIDASNITVGTLGADRIGAGSIAIGKLDTSTQTKINNVVKQSIETIIGTQTSSTYTWTGTSSTLTASDLVDGLTINYFLPFSVGGSQVSATYKRLSDNANVNTSGAVLNLTFSDGTSTGNLPIWYQGVGRLTSHYGYGSIIKMTYYKNIRMANAYEATGWWVDAQYNSDTYDNRIIYFTGKTGTKGIWAGSLFMEDASGTYQGICCASDGTITNASSGNGARTTATTKIANASGFKVGSTIYYTNTSYNANTNISGYAVVYSNMGNVFDSRYCMNTTLTANSLTTYKPWYLVGSINSSDGLFYLDSTWWTQTPNVTGKVYILGGGVYDSTTSNCRITLYEDNVWYIYNGSALVPYEKYASDQAAKTATTYITDIDSNKGITIKPADTSGNDYLQMNSSAINFYRNNVETLKIEDSAIRVGKLGNNLRNVYITDSAVQIRNNTSVLAEYGSSIKLYKPGTTTAAVEISSTGATFNGNVKATSLSTGTKTASTTGKGIYIDGNGNIYAGNGSSNNFTVTSEGAMTAKSGTIGKYTITSTCLYTGTGNTQAGIGGNQAFWAGGTDSNSAPFRVSYSGVLNATGATISGSITATSGTIGGASISDGILQITNTNISGTISANHIDASSLSIGISQVSNLQSTLDGKASTSAVTTAAQTASKYISVIDQNGIKVHAENNKNLNYTKISSQAIIMYQNGNDVMNLKTNQFRIGTNTGNNIKIDTNGITINNGSTQVASYKDSIILGDKVNNNLLFLDKSSLSLRSGVEDYLSGNEVFEVGECAETISKTVTSGQASYQWSELTNNTKELKEVTLNGELLEEGVDYTFNLTTGTITLTNAPTNSTAKLKVSFIPMNPEAIQKTITFTTPEEEYWLLRSFYTIPQHVVNIFSVSLNGTVLTSSQYSYDSSTHILKIPATPTESNAPVAGSTVEVVYTKSLGYYYTLGKRDLTKIGDYSIATGYNCLAAGDKSFAGGSYTYVAGQNSFGYGFGTGDADCVRVYGNSCGGIGKGITVYGEGNFGCGNYNVPSSSYIFSVGNGSSSTDRKNAFYVAKSGNARVAGNLSVMRGIQVAGQMRSYKKDGSGTVPLFQYSTKKKSNISIAANNVNSGLTCDITLPNHTPVGIVGMRILNSSSSGANAPYCNLYIYMIINNSSESHVTFSIKNFASSAAKVDVEFKILYIANEALSSTIEW